MKQLTTILFILLTVGLFGQWGWDSEYDCKQHIVTGEWFTIDTIGEYKDTLNEWVYSEWKYNMSIHVTLEYSYCGKDSHTWQFRACKNSGIRQKRLEHTYYERIKKPLTEYEQLILDLKNK